MAGALRRPGLGLAAVVGVSTILHWLAGRRLPGPWIMPDEVIYALRGVAFWRSTSLPVLHGQGAGYSIVYPILAGLPLALFSLAKGYAVLKGLQAFVMSLSAVVVYYFGRRVMPERYALLAAALTVASPLLLYSGFLMTEVAVLPPLGARGVDHRAAVETGRPRDQLLALLGSRSRSQHACRGLSWWRSSPCASSSTPLGRSWRRLRLFWPIWTVLALTALTRRGAPGLFGAYAGDVLRRVPGRRVVASRLLPPCLPVL